MNLRPSTSVFVSEDELQIKLYGSKVYFTTAFVREFNRKCIFTLDYGTSLYSFVVRKKPLSPNKFRQNM